jgi:hypothetical protein
MVVGQAVGSSVAVAGVPLQLVDSFLIDYHVGHALVLGFVLTVLATIPLKSLKTTAGVVVTFGLVFALTPGSLMGTAATPLRLAGVGFVVIGPMLFVYANR